MSLSTQIYADLLLPGLASHPRKAQSPGTGVMTTYQMGLSAQMIGDPANAPLECPAMTTNAG